MAAASAYFIRIPPRVIGVYNNQRRRRLPSRQARETRMNFRCAIQRLVMSDWLGLQSLRSLQFCADRKHSRKHRAVAAVQTAVAFLVLPGTIASFTALATRNFTTFLAGMLICWPVAGLRPILAFRSTRTSLPRPGTTKTPVFLTSFRAVAASDSSTCLAVLFEISQFSARV